MATTTAEQLIIERAVKLIKQFNSNNDVPLDTLDLNADVEAIMVLKQAIDAMPNYGPFSNLVERDVLRAAADFVNAWCNQDAAYDSVATVAYDALEVAVALWEDTDGGKHPI